MRGAHARPSRPSTRPRTMLAALIGLGVVAGMTPAVAEQEGQTPQPSADLAAGVGDPADLALHRAATGSAPCRPGEIAAQAVNGSVAGGYGDKWCSGDATRWMVVDLGETRTLDSFTVRHAQAGGEDPGWNTRDFDIAVSDDNQTFTTVAAVRGNTKGLTNHPAATRGRYLRLDVLDREQPARIYSFEAYGAPTTCFPYPHRDPTKRPQPSVDIGSDVPELDDRYLDAARLLWQTRWPGVWQTFAYPSIVDEPAVGISRVLISTADSASFNGSTLHLPYRDLVSSVDAGNVGTWLHESAHLLQLDYAARPAPLFTEGITDFIRFVGYGDDPTWTVAAEPVPADAAGVWNGGYRVGARFLLWLTQRFDTSGARYRLVYDLNAKAAEGRTDLEAVVAEVVGRPFADLAEEYLREPGINPHC
jgi:hypothetical protein